MTAEMQVSGLKTPHVRRTSTRRKPTDALKRPTDALRRPTNGLPPETGVVEGLESDRAELDGVPHRLSLVLRVDVVP